MPFTKKKMYRMHVRELTLAGKYNTSEGNWTTTAPATSAARDVVEGTLGGEPGVGRPRKGGKVHWSIRADDFRTLDWPVLPKNLRGPIHTKGTVVY